MVSEGIRRTVLIAYLFTALGRVADALFFLVLFERLSVASVGLFSSVMAMAAFFGAVMDFGLAQVLVREFSRRSLTFREAVYVSCLIRVPLVLTGLVGFIVWIWHSAPPFERYAAIGIAGAIQVLLVSESLVQAWLKANARQNTSNMIAFLDPLGRFLAISVLIASGAPVSVTQLFSAILAIHIGIASVHVAIAMRFLTAEERLPGIRAGASPLSALFRSGGVFALMAFVIVAQNRADWLLLSHYAGPVHLANYALANKLYEILLMGLGVTMLTVYPWICSQKRTRLRDVRMDIILNMVLASGVTLSLGAGIYLPTLIAAFFNDKYELAKPVIQLLLPLAAISSYVHVRYYEMVSRGLERSLLKYTTFATVLQLAVNWLLIPHFGAMGSVAGMTTMVTSMLVLYLICCIRYEILSVEKLFRELSFAGFMTGIALVLWLFCANIFLGLLCLGLGGVIGTIFVLLAPRSKAWLLGYIRRRSVVLFWRRKS